MCIITLCGCWNNLQDTTEEEETDTKSLNDIRFANFKEEDWLDNEYIRCLRKYIDDYNDGLVDDEIPDQCKDKLKGKFIVIQTQPYLMGGLFIQLVFVDHPDEDGVVTARFGWPYLEYKEENFGVHWYDEDEEGEDNDEIPMMERLREEDGTEVSFV